MALSPIDRYKDQLLAYGLGQGGIQSPTEKTFTAPVSGGSVQRKMRSGIGGSVGSRRSPFSEEGAGLFVEDLSPYRSFNYTHYNSYYRSSSTKPFKILFLRKTQKEILDNNRQMTSQNCF